MTDTAGILVDVLRRPRLEVMPLDGVEKKVIGHVPRELTVTVTSSPTRGIEATLALAAHGYRVVPHLAARLVSDRARLRDLLARLADSGVREVFVVAGDIGQRAGGFEGAAVLLAAIAEVGHGLEEIGITGYPSGRIGLGESARFLRRHGSWLGRLMLPRAYSPDELLERLAPHLARPDNRVAGLHVYTFNEIERAERWRRETVARLAGRGL